MVPLARMDSASLKMIALLPNPNLAGTSNNYLASASLPYKRDNGDIKINYNPSEKYSLFARYRDMNYQLSDYGAFGSGGGPAVGGGQPGNGYGPTYSVTIGGAVIFTPHLLMD